MLIACIEGANLKLIGDPAEGIVDIHARRELVGEWLETTVAFEPTPAELKALNEGKPVYVTILGVDFPPIRCEVKS